MAEGHEGLGQIHQAGKRPPVEWKVKNVKNEEQTVTILFPDQHEEQVVARESDSHSEG